MSSVSGILTFPLVSHLKAALFSLCLEEEVISGLAVRNL